MDASITIRLDAKTKQKLQEAADKSRRKLSDYCRIVLEEATKKKTKPS